MKPARILAHDRLLRWLVVVIVFFALPIICAALALIYGLDFKIPMGEMGRDQSIRALVLPMVIWIGIGLVVLKLWLAEPIGVVVEESQPVSLKTIIISIALVLLFVAVIFVLCMNNSA